MLGDKCIELNKIEPVKEKVKHAEGVIMNFKQGGQDRLP